MRSQVFSSSSHSRVVVCYPRYISTEHHSHASSFWARVWLLPPWSPQGPLPVLPRFQQLPDSPPTPALSFPAALTSVFALHLAWWGHSKGTLKDLPWSAYAIKTKCLLQGDWNDTHIFLAVLEARSPRSRCCPIRLLKRACFLDSR